MSCTMTVYNTVAKTKSQYVCDEDNTTRVVEDEHNSVQAGGEYTDAKGRKFSVDWTRCRLISFARQTE